MPGLQVPEDPVRDEEFDQAFEQLTRFVDFSGIDQMHPRRENAVYTTSVVLWMLIYQRMKTDSSLAQTVKHLLETNPGFLPENKRIREGTLSGNSGGYSKARKRMPLDAVRWFAEFVSDSLINQTPAAFHNRRVFLLDGTTITLAPEPELQRAFPPASNQYREGVWPIAQLVVAHEMSSGAALIPEIGCMYGPNAVSETTLIHQHLKHLPADSIVMADAGFGIFNVAWSIANQQHGFVLRMTKSRFASLTKKARLADDTGDVRTWTHRWEPTAKERKTNDLPTDACLEVTLHEVRINANLTLLLVTSLADATADELTDLYAHRVDVEIDIRNLKVVLDTENIQARSVDTFRKELYASVISYNLVSQFRRQAADLISEPPRRLSFKGVWDTYRTFLLRHMFTDTKQWRAKFREALSFAMMDKLPNRPGRSFKREAYAKRPKSNQFDKRTRTDQR